jgi:hypothetical protein
MKQIITKLERSLIIKELERAELLGFSKKNSHPIYVVNYSNNPYTLFEIGRLREEAYRFSGGGTGKEFDLDNYDLNPNGYDQIIVWDDKNEEIVGGYRFIECNKSKNSTGDYQLATSKLYKYSEPFKEQYLPYSIELGRSFVQLSYQTSHSQSKVLYALASVWDGLSLLLKKYPEVKFLFGKLTMQKKTNPHAIWNLIVFLKHYFPSDSNLVHVVEKIDCFFDEHEILKVFKDLNFNEGYKVLKKTFSLLNAKIPPLINSYMKISSTMQAFDVSVNTTFGNAYEQAILMAIDNIDSKVKDRHS